MAVHVKCVGDLGLIAVVPALGSVLRLWIKAFDRLKKSLQILNIVRYNVRNLETMRGVKCKD